MVIHEICISQILLFLLIFFTDSFCISGYLFVLKVVLTVKLYAKTREDKKD